MVYRAEVDGLRAIAVISVILFHAGFKLFKGGFVGVDVFFVISGYLITTLIINEIIHGEFSLINFYERRARRILPALYFIIVVSLTLAWFLLLPSDLKNFSQSLMAVVTFSSNILFWRESGYFDTNADLKPLLHTWSLAVEEQYYIVYPLFLLFVWRYGKKWMLTILGIVFLLSLGTSYWGAYNKPVASFYLLPTRGWELILGIFSAVYLEKYNYSQNKAFNQLGSILGISLIIFSIFTYNDQAPFPGIYALAPTLGTVLLLQTSVKGTWIYKILSFKPVVGIGIISYSAYLWHQPMLAFLKYKTTTTPSTITIIAICLMCIILAYFSWRYVERPFRNKSVVSRRLVFQLSIIIFLVFFGVGYTGYKLNGFNKVDTVTDININEKVDVPFNVMLLGDSHAAHLYAGLKKFLGRKIVNRSSPGCIPLFDVDRYDYRFTKGSCARKMNAALNEFIHSRDYGYLIMSTMGPVYLDNTAFRNTNIDRVKGANVVLVSDKSIKNRWNVFKIGMEETLNALSKLKNKKVIFFLDVPELGIDNKLCLADGINRYILGINFQVQGPSPRVNENCRILRSEYDLRASKYKNMVYELIKSYPGIILIDPTDYFCDKKYCYGIKNGKSLYRDWDHLSNYGSSYVASIILEKSGFVN